jgi:uncharacterized protein YjbI with pentapeptide repeats
MSTVEIRNTSGIVIYTHTAHGATLKTALEMASRSGICLLAPDLQGADLSGVNLPDGQLWAANLTGANLRRATLGAACLDSARLQGADLRGASLGGAEIDDDGGSDRGQVN